MSAGFNFLFLLFFVAAIAATSIPFLILALVGKRKQSPLMIGLGCIPGAAILVGAFVLFCLLIYGFAFPWSDSSDPSEARSEFISNFSMDPGSDFVPLHEETAGLADFGCLYLVFRVSPATFEKIRQEGFQESSGFPDVSRGTHVPTWWTPPEPSPGAACYEKEKAKGPGSSNTAYLIYESKTNTVYFFVAMYD